MQQLSGSNPGEEAQAEREAPRVSIRGGGFEVHWPDDPLRPMQKIDEGMESYKRDRLPNSRQRAAGFRVAILEFLLGTGIPTDVENIRKGVGARNWESVKALCLELAIEGKIKYTRTSRGYLFWKVNQR